MNKLLSGFTLIVLLVLSSTSYAGKGPPMSLSDKDTKFYAGLKWTVGAGTTPAVVLGVMRIKVESNDDRKGANLSFDFGLGDKGGLGQLKLGLLYGKEKLQGELGGGYDFAKGAPLYGVGINAPHVNTGIEIRDGRAYVPFFTLHTLGKFGSRRHHYYD